MTERELLEIDHPVVEHDLKRSYRVEHRLECGCVSLLAQIHNVFPHHDTLMPFVSHLCLDDARQPLGGELVLVDDLTGAIQARRDLKRLSREPRIQNRKAAGHGSSAYRK